MVLSRLAWAVVVLALAATRAGAAPPPDRAQLVAMRDAFDSGVLIGVTERGHERLTRHPRADAAGLVVPLSRGRPALVIVGDVAPAERRIAWSDVDRVDRLYTRSRLGLLAGALFGAVVTTFVVSTYGSDLSETGDHVVLAAGVAFSALTAIGGAVIGAANPRRAPLYP